MCSCGGRGMRNVVGNRRRTAPVVPQQVPRKSVRPTETRLKEMKKVEEKEKNSSAMSSLARREILRKHRIAVQRALGR